MTSEFIEINKMMTSLFLFVSQHIYVLDGISIQILKFPKRLDILVTISQLRIYQLNVINITMTSSKAEILMEALPL